jgi:hypothetical protein
VQEAGGVVTDAGGGSLRDRPLLGSGHEFQMSCIAAANPELHGMIVEEVEAGVARLRDGAAARPSPPAGAL